MKGQQIFKHEYPNALFNFNENMIIHRGLYKALQISNIKYFDLFHVMEVMLPIKEA